MEKIKSLVFVFLFFVCSLQAYTQPVEQNVKLIIAPDHANWQYNVGEKVKFKVSVLQYGNPLKNVKVKYELGPERMASELSGAIELEDGQHTISGGTMKIPGFYRCTVSAEVNGKTYKGLATVGFNPDKISGLVD